MKQYYSIKAVHPDAILLFRVGDFYETFGDDAIKASGILGITLTRRANGAATYVELAGFPYHAIDTYLPKLVRAGERVAICEQLEDPKLVKGLVKRGVIELVTPGIVLGDNILANKENNYIASIYFGRRTTGAAFLDISTGEFYAAEGTDAYIDKLISNLAPKEVIYQRGYEDRFTEAFGSRLYTYRLDEWVFSEEVNREKLCKQFGTPSLKGFGVEHFTSGIAPPAPSSTTSNSPSTARRATSAPSRASTRTTTCGSTSSRSATSNSSPRTVPARKGASPRRSTARSPRWAVVCSSGGSPCRSAIRNGSTSASTRSSSSRARASSPKSSASRWR